MGSLRLLLLVRDVKSPLSRLHSLPEPRLFLSRPSRPPLTLPCDSYHHLNVLNKDTFRNVACIHLRRRARRGNLASARLFALPRTEPNGCERPPTSFDTQRVFSVQGVSGHRGRVRVALTEGRLLTPGPGKPSPLHRPRLPHTEPAARSSGARIVLAARRRNKTRVLFSPNTS